MSQKEKYLEEFEKYKNVELSYGRWRLKSNNFIQYDIVTICDDFVRLETVHTKNVVEKTPHWCRKNLEKVSE